MGKLFERIVTNRIANHLTNISPDIADHQYGFQKGHSMIDAIDHVISTVQSSVSQGGVALAVSIDIINAFNSLPWSKINEALYKHRAPKYLRNVIANYFSKRSIIYTTVDGLLANRKLVEHTGKSNTREGRTEISRYIERATILRHALQSLDTPR